jgi:hypothetical protein
MFSRPISSVRTELVYDSRKDELFAAARKHNGNLKLIADECSIALHLLQKCYREKEEFKTVVDDAREALYEDAEANLVKKIGDGSMQALQLFFSKSPQAKARGWGEKVEQDTTMKLSAQQKEEQVRKMLGLDGE